MKTISLLKKKTFNTSQSQILPYSIKNMSIVNTFYKTHRNKNLSNSCNKKYNFDRNTNIIKTKILKFNSLNSSLPENKTSNITNFKRINLYQSAVLKQIKSTIDTKSKFRKNNSSNNVLNNLKNYERKFFSASFKFNTKDNSKKLKFFSNNSSRSISNIFRRQKHDNLPIFANIPVIYSKNCKSLSERERDEKNTSKLSKLKYFLTIYWKQRKNIITEFFDKNLIYNIEYYNKDNLENFAHYIFDNVSNNITNCSKNIDTKKTMKEIIEQGIKYKDYSPKDPKNFNKKDKILINSEINLEKRDSIKINNEKIKNLRKFLHDNYKSNINNYFFRGKNKGELSNYESKKIGIIDIKDKNNIANNIEKQSNFSKLKSTSFFIRKPNSIYDFDEKDYNEISEEIEDIKNNYIEYDIKNKKNENKKNKNIFNKMYSDAKRKTYDVQPEIILKNKKKLLEYVILNNVKERQEFVKDLLK